MESVIENFAINIAESNLVLSYIFFFASQSLQILFPPYPGDMVLILEGYLSGAADFNIFLIIINATLATTLSSILLYRIGVREEEKILHSKVVKRFFPTDKANRIEELFQKYGPAVILFSKIIPGIFSITILSAGVFRVKKSKVYTSVFIVTAIHHTLLIVLGKLLGENWKIILRRMHIYNKYIIILIVIFALIYLVLLLIKKKILD